MTALTLTPRPDVGASVLINVTGAPAGAVRIGRTDANGTGYVRLLDGQTPISGALEVSDFEAALVGTITYSVRDSANALVSKSTTLEGLADYTPHLLVAAQPNLRVDVNVLMDNPTTQDAMTTFHDVIGRPDTIPTITGPMRKRAGTLTFRVPDYGRARQVAGLAYGGQTLMLRQPTHPGMDMYFAVSAVDTKKAEFASGGWFFDVELAYRETANPVTPLTGTVGWNWNSVKAYGTWADVLAGFSSWAALQAGPPPVSPP